MLKKLTKKGTQKKTIMCDRKAFASECIIECIPDCYIDGSKVTTDYRLSSMY